MSMLSFTQSVANSGHPSGSRATLSTPLARASWYTQGKVVFDFVLALVLLVLTAPLIVFSMLLVKCSSPGPIIYSQTRLGRGGRPFTIYKLRSMTHNCESLTGARWSQPGDARVTAVGRFLRKTHLDELPQLWNVLRGDMSLIGPRPERPEFAPQLAQALGHYHDRLQVRPGVTGIAQVQLPADSDLDSVRLKLAYDLHYVRHVTFWLDLRIYAATFFKMTGVPFHVLRGVFVFATRESIEAEYLALCAARPRGEAAPAPVSPALPASPAETCADGPLASPAETLADAPMRAMTPMP
jgi:lipopolysaccharide/colanic/teichoic acid biosynthesis glycosyltransferase